MFRLSAIITTLCALLCPGNTASAEEKAAAMIQNFYDFSFQTIDGKDMPMSAYKGKVVLVVNTASKCGFTKQYKGLQSLYEQYKEKDFVVLGVPSNDFMGQEPGSNAEIKKFCELTFGIDFPMTEKVSVKGKDAHPFYQWAALQENGDKPGWNFHKFLISKDGKLLDSFGSSVTPDDAKLTSAVDKALAAAP